MSDVMTNFTPEMFSMALLRNPVKSESYLYVVMFNLQKGMKIHSVMFQLAACTHKTFTLESTST
ncbi:hypothetical protein Hanom_Chr05g00416411 [Helianthus anomalus]